MSPPDRPPSSKDPAPQESAPLVLNDTVIPPGTRSTISIPVSRRYTAGEVSLPAYVVHGNKPGPRLFVSAAIHGDEINGVEIIRRLLKLKVLTRLRGALITVPIVNVYGFVAQTRYLPDRRDLNRSFPGSPAGSLASRLAHTFMTEIVNHATHGIDLHTGSLHRSNLPQVRASLESPGTEQLARSFGAPVILDSKTRPGSLRDAVRTRGIPMIVYEAGEALRFDEVSIRGGVKGITSVMRELGMLPATKTKPKHAEPFVAHGSAWVRSPDSGILNTRLQLGARVEKGQLLGVITDPLGEAEIEVVSPTEGVVIGRTNLPLMNEGDALFHIAVFEQIEPVAEAVDSFQDAFDPGT